MTNVIGNYCSIKCYLLNHINIREMSVIISPLSLILVPSLEYIHDQGINIPSTKVLSLSLWPLSQGDYCNDEQLDRSIIIESVDSISGDVLDTPCI